MTKSWRTTVAGIAAILTAVGSGLSAFAGGQPIPWETLVPAVLAGVGLLAARDHSVSSEQAGLKP